MIRFAFSCTTVRFKCTTAKASYVAQGFGIGAVMHASVGLPVFRVLWWPTRRRPLLLSSKSIFFSPTLSEFAHYFQLQGRIDDCSCNINTVDTFNNVKVYPRLRSLLNKDYFRFYKVNLKRDCPFWPDDSRCAIRYCRVEPCQDDDIPSGLKGRAKKIVLMSNNGGEKVGDEIPYLCIDLAIRFSVESSA